MGHSKGREAIAGQPIIIGSKGGFCGNVIRHLGAIQQVIPLAAESKIIIANGGSR
jgi:hypothetical protein